MKTNAEIEREIKIILADEKRTAEWRSGFKYGEEAAHEEIRNYGYKSAKVTLDQLKAMCRSDFEIGQAAGYDMAINGMSAAQRYGTSRGKGDKVTVDTKLYRSTHGVEPRGRGSWTFIIGKTNYSHNDDPAIYRPGVGAIAYAKARDRAIAEAKRRGASVVGVAP